MATENIKNKANRIRKSRREGMPGTRAPATVAGRRVAAATRREMAADLPAPLSRNMPRRSLRTGRRAKVTPSAARAGEKTSPRRGGDARNATGTRLRRIKGEVRRSV